MINFNLFKKNITKNYEREYIRKYIEKYGNLKIDDNTFYISVNKIFINKALENTEEEAYESLIDNILENEDYKNYILKCVKL